MNLRHLVLVLSLFWTSLSYAQSGRQKGAQPHSEPIDLLAKEQLDSSDVTLYYNNHKFYYAKGPYYNIRLVLRLLPETEDPLRPQHLHS